MADNGKIIWDNLIKLGYTEVATAGIMGNLMAESGLNPKRVQSDSYIEADNITVDGETGYGLAQWTFSTRQQNLADYANSKGRPSGDLMVQIDFLNMEIDQYGIKNKLNEQSTPSAAALYFHDAFENSADSDEQKQRRATYAEEIYAKKGEDCANISYSGDSSTYSFGGSLAGVVAGIICAANSSPKLAGSFPHGKHTDSIFKNPSKTYCEPVYPDLVGLNNKIPDVVSQDVFDKASDKELIQGANLVYTMPSGVLSKYGGADYLNQQALSLQIEQQRKQSFDPKKNQYSFKMPSIGKPPNNDDPFPYDAKIKEFETHKPRCKIETIRTCPEAANVAKACMQLSTNVEKRIVKLENNLATIMRYLARIGSRISINCVYWGGTTCSEKYNTIRCMKDNRIDDGQYVSIDQCMTCTRFEPLIGQSYDILNDSGINLSQILDDCQMSYTTMEEYCKFVKPTEHQSILPTTSLNFANIGIRDANEKDFSAEWGKGIKMSWKLFPVEDQKVHINKYQNINGDEYSNLESFQDTAVNAGTTYTSPADNRMIINKKRMDDIISKEG